MIIKTTRSQFETTSGFTFLVDEDIFLPTVTAVRGQEITLRGASPQSVRVYPQEGELIDTYNFLTLISRGKVSLVACEKGWHQL